MTYESTPPTMGYGSQYGGETYGTEQYGTEFLYAPLYIANQSPAPGTTDVAGTATVQFDLLQGDNPVLLATVTIYVEGALAYTGSTDTFSAPYNGASSLQVPIAGPPAGFHFEIEKTASWASSGTVSVRAVGQDEALTTLDQTWYFHVEDYAPPTFTANSPTGSGVAKDTTVYFETDDVGGSGVDQTSIDVVIGGASAIASGVIQAGFSGSIAADGSGGYDVTIDKDTDYGSVQTVGVAATAADLDGNSDTLNWSFITEDYLGPQVVPISPLADAGNVPLDSNIVVQLNDETEVVLSSILIYIKSGTDPWELVYEGGGAPDFKPGWDGPQSAITGTATSRTVTIDKTSALVANTETRVLVFAQDAGGRGARL